MGDLETGLLNWSQRLTSWQRDLLRRFALGEVLIPSDFRAYADAAERDELGKAAEWFTTPDLGDLGTFSPLEVIHLRTTVEGADPVSVTKILHLEGANDLAEGAFLSFETGGGLTIVAGRNGSGKSGYTRILKQVAASRGSETVLPNAFSADVVPKAVVSYQVGTAVAEDLTWEAGGDRIESPLQRVRVFDALAASAHLAGSTEIAYVPTTLQVLADYTRALQEITSLIDSDLQHSRLQLRQWPELEMGAGLDVFDHLGEPSGVEALRSFTALTDEEKEELDEIPAKLRDLTASNPAALAIQARGRASQLTTLARNFEIVAARLDPTEVETSVATRAAVNSAAEAVEEARRQVQVEESLQGVDSESWRDLWDAAKEFVERDGLHEFPDTADDSICPLCQQRLDDAARTRFQEYATFMEGEAQANLVAARKLRQADVDALNVLPLNTMITQDLVDLVSTYNSDLGPRLLPLIALATNLRDSLLGAEAEDENPQLSDQMEDSQGDDDDNDLRLETEIQEVAAALRKAAETEAANAERLAGVDTSAIAAAQLSARQEALVLRREIVARKAEVGAQHDLTLRIQRLQDAARSCDTTGVSRQNTQLSRSYVEKVCSRFETEAQAFGLDRVPVELIFDRSSRGVSYIKVSLKDAAQVPVASVLSEGEQRVTAIAGFFADLTESGDQSTLVFDDPVSSLDQEFRVKVAQRLLEEAEVRQVLVFTHDFSFVQYLYEEKRIQNLAKQAAGSVAASEIKYLHIDRAMAGAGVVTNAEQWRHVSVGERIRRLNERIQNVAVLYRNSDNVAYEKEARDIVGAIRDTWEALVEQELLNAVVTRHDRRVQTQRLAKVSDISSQDVAVVELGMTLESRFLTGHASPVSDGSGMQPPNWLTAELESLKTFRSAVNRRR